MTGVDLIGQDRAHQFPGLLGTCRRGRVVEPPSGVRQTMQVQLIGESSQQPYEIPGTNWMPRTDVSVSEAPSGVDWVIELPVLGSVCLVIFDNWGDAWVSAWG